MSVIQKIRDKAAWLIFGAIALAMIGFIVTDAFQGRGRGLFSSRNTTLGRVNGKKIDYLDFQKRLKLQEDQYTTAGYQLNDMMRQNIQDNLWNQMVEDELMQKEYSKLGLDEITDKEVGDILYGNNPPPDLKQQFTDKQTGQYDANAAYQAIQQLKKQKNNQIARNFFELYIPTLIKNRQREKYISLLANTAYAPKWMVEKMMSDNSQIASISYVDVPYSTVSDSAAKISDDEITEYIKKHPQEFKQEESRTIAYVTFSAAPSSADSAAVKQGLEKLKVAFDSTTNFQAFLAANGTEKNYVDAFVVKSKIAGPFADFLRNLSEGRVFGPYLENGAYVLAKMINKRTMPDSVKVRHILITTQNGTPDSVAKKRIDSIAAAIKNGADFKALAAKNSDDPGSKDKGGEYEFSSDQANTLAKEFAEAAFYGNKGDKKVIKTSFGYHYMEVLDQKNIQPAYKIAYLTRSIVPSPETENTASGLANQFAGQSRTAKTFDKNITSKNLHKLVGPDVKPNDYSVPGLGSSRQFVRWIYDASEGDVSEPFLVEDKYVVAVLTEINHEGLMKASRARPMTEVLIRNQKKASLINKKLGNISSLETAASATGQTVRRSDSISFSSPFIPNVGQELKVIGAAFNRQWQGKIAAPISGNGGLFVIKPESVSAKPNPSSDIEQQRTMMMTQMRSAESYRAIEVIKKAANIKDYRGEML